MGNTISHTPGFVAKDHQELNEFTMAGDDQKFVAAKAVIRGNEVLVSSELAGQHKVVRFA